jgi:FtsX-like permease family
LVIDETVRVLPVAGLIPTAPDAPQAPATLMIADLSELQKIAGKVGRIDRVEFVVEPGPRLEQRRAEVRDLLQTLALTGSDSEGEARWSVEAPGARREAAEAMTRAFSLNLTVLSLIALLTGLYLIFQALDGAVVRRRAEIAILRSLGVEERAIRRLWLAESALLGLCGGALGLVLGWAGAQLAVRAVGQTINALYYAHADRNRPRAGAGCRRGVGRWVLACSRGCAHAARTSLATRCEASRRCAFGTQSGARSRTPNRRRAVCAIAAVATGRRRTLSFGRLCGGVFMGFRRRYCRRFLVAAAGTTRPRLGRRRCAR